MLLLAEENTAVFITTPTEAEMATAITKSIRNVMAVVRHSLINLKKLLTLRLRSELFKSLSACISEDSRVPCGHHEIIPNLYHCLAQARIILDLEA